ncbi:MAG: CDP-alcohol phosphatidyltransferase family protein [Candidatus Micrarchaeota archaeon]|nr:CDP-alcohol phosphatidyltransferase family protein [Candidatus Micrarchaeota archaeon]
MRDADKATVIRLLILFAALYLVILKVNPAIPIAMFAISLALDGVDGYLALRQQSKGKVGLMEYLHYALGDRSNAKAIKALKQGIEKSFAFGPRIDIAGDRITEYALWVLFLFLHIVPLFVILIIIVRHSVTDAFMGARGTSSKMRTWIGRAVYSSNLARGGINVVKFVTFSYLMLVYISNYPLWIGYLLIALLVIYIVLRGVAEMAEVMAEQRESKK